MPRYVAFLRAINVGKRRVQMAQLAQHFSNAGFDDVATHIVSGNVIFTHASKSTAKLERDIEAMLVEQLGFASEAFVRSAKDMQQLMARTEKLAKKERDYRAIYVGFLKETLDKAHESAVAAFCAAPDHIEFVPQAWIWVAHGPLSDSPLSGPKAAKAIGQPTTIRSLTMLEKLLDKHGLD